jgi:hypothetical protein
VFVLALGRTAVRKLRLRLAGVAFLAVVLAVVLTTARPVLLLFLRTPSVVRAPKGYSGDLG